MIKRSHLYTKPTQTVMIEVHVEPSDNIFIGLYMRTIMILFNC